MDIKETVSPLICQIEKSYSSLFFWQDMIILSSAILSSLVLMFLFRRYVYPFLERRFSSSSHLTIKHSLRAFLFFIFHLLIAFALEEMFYFFLHQKIMISILDRLLKIYIYAIICSLFIQLLEVFHDYYKRTRAKPISIKSYIQISKFIILFLGFILSFSALFQKSILYAISGLSAFAAVLMFVFKDNITGFIASVKVALNGTLKEGDWVVFKSKEVEGFVDEITLMYVKVRCFDNSFVLVPTGQITEETIQNKSAIGLSGMRLMKRSLYLDPTSISFIPPEQILELMAHPYLSSEVLQKAHEEGHDGEKITNISLLQLLILDYLENMENVITNGEKLFLVRTLEQRENGLPVEIYAFIKCEKLVEFEKIQSHIVNHFLGLLPLLELRSYADR